MIIASFNKFSAQFLEWMIATSVQGTVFFVCIAAIVYFRRKSSPVFISIKR